MLFFIFVALFVIGVLAAIFIDECCGCMYACNRDFSTCYKCYYLR